MKKTFIFETSLRNKQNKTRKVYFTVQYINKYFLTGIFITYSLLFSPTTENGFNPSTFSNYQILFFCGWNSNLILIYFLGKIRSVTEIYKGSWPMRNHHPPLNTSQKPNNLSRNLSLRGWVWKKINLNFNRVEQVLLRFLQKFSTSSFLVSCTSLLVGWVLRCWRIRLDIDQVTWNLFMCGWLLRNVEDGMMKCEMHLLMMMFFTRVHPSRWRDDVSGGPFDLPHSSSLITLAIDDETGSRSRSHEYPQAHTPTNHCLQSWYGSYDYWRKYETNLWHFGILPKASLFMLVYRFINIVNKMGLPELSRI